MALDFNKNLPDLPAEYTAPVPVADDDDSLAYQIYPSDNPETPYVPTNPANSWWQALPYWTDEDGAGGGWTNINPELPMNKTGSIDLESLKDTNPKLYEELRYSDPQGAQQFAQDFNASFVNDTGKSVDQLNTDVFKRTSSKPKYRKYNTYTGSDIVPTITMPNGSSHTVGTISTISVSVHSETFPVRMLGKRGSQGFTRGPRTIAGSLIFTQFDLYPFYDMVNNMEFPKGTPPWETGQDVFPLADSLPPFDITISFQNEYGNYDYESRTSSAANNVPRGSVLRLYGVVIVDDGLTLSIDDLVPENVYSYMAAGIAPMHHPKGWRLSQ